MRGGRRALIFVLLGAAACSTFGGTDEPAAPTGEVAPDAGVDARSLVTGTPEQDAADGKAKSGADGSADDGSTSVPDFTIAMTPPTVATSLGTTTHYSVTLTSKDGFAGMVSLSPIAVPATWAATVESPSLTLAAGEQSTVDLMVTVPTDAIASSASIGVRGAGSTTHDASVSMAVANELLIDIADGTGAGDHHFPGLTNIRLGTKVRFRDLDSTAGHRIHSDGGGGFLHQPPPSMTQGMEYVVTPTETITYGWYCHDHASANNSLIVK